ncbi:MAG: hypothetical protein COA92_01230 [Sulfurovum sp.]|nr:MAG: hypothetical protein COA92_01230 [Sulfurovum sp.]
MQVNIEVKEILTRVISVDEAISEVEDMYFREEVVLDYTDFDGNVKIIDISN